MNRTSRSVLSTLVVLVIVAALGFIYASPYIVLNRVKRAADARDAQTVNQYVDFPALRESLKEQVTALLTRRVDIQKSGNPLAIIGAMIGAAVVGPLVDSYATPDGVAAILNGIPPRGNPGEQPPRADDVPSADPPAAPAPGAATAQENAPQTPLEARQEAPKQPPMTTARYRGLNTFVVTYQHGAGDAKYSAIFHRDGLVSWKLVAVDLNG
ncbi:membrane protein [Caballeronia peredens]|nr:membrane protein [Caballeronia peredens]